MARPVPDPSSPFAVAVEALAAGRSTARIARDSGLPYAAVRGAREGLRPPRADELARIAGACGASGVVLLVAGRPCPVSRELLRAAGIAVVEVAA